MIRLIVLFFILTLLNQVILARGEYGVVEKTGNTLETPLLLLDTTYKKTDLNTLLDKPTLLNFTYYHCTGTCDKLMDGMAEIIAKSEYEIGIDYQVITISIDPYDDIHDGLRIKKQLIDSFYIQQARESWNFYVIDSSSLHTLSEFTGYHFWREKLHFIHPQVSVLLCPNGMISQYFYGTWILPWDFQMAVDRAAKEQTGVSRKTKIKYCYNFTPKENLIVRQIAVVSGIFILLFSILLFLYLVLSNKRHLK